MQLELPFEEPKMRTATEVQLRVQEAKKRFAAYYPTVAAWQERVLLNVLCNMLQDQIDEEGCGAVFGEVRVQLWRTP